MHGKIIQIFFIIATLGCALPSDVDLDSTKCSNIQSNTKSILIVGLVSAIVFSFVGIFPSIFIRTDADEKKFVDSNVFKYLLAFAAGSLIADVFLHLLPENSVGVSESQAINNGLLTIASFLVFLMIEKVTEFVPNAHALGTLNLIANFLDNSAHGTTVVGAFQNSLKFGMVALIATVLHEVPHEFSDFALLLRDGYTRKSAVIAQLITAFAGTIGATFAYALASNAELRSTCHSTNNFYLPENQIHHNHEHHMHGHHGGGSIIIPFTIGGFLYIALVGIIPEIVNEENKKTSFFQIVFFVTGIAFIYALTQFETIVANYFSSTSSLV